MKEVCAALLIAGLLACNDTALGGPTGNPDDSADTFDVSPVDFGDDTTDDTTDDHGDETGDAGMGSLDLPSGEPCCLCVGDDLTCLDNATPEACDAFAAAYGVETCNLVTSECYCA